MRAEASLAYAGPAFLKNTIAKWWPEQKTIFHRVKTYQLNATTDFEKVAMLKDFNVLEEIRFYSFDNFDRIEFMKKHFPEWELEKLSKSRFRIVKN